jgi:hypothetical protein
LGQVIIEQTVHVVMCDKLCSTHHT